MDFRSRYSERKASTISFGHVGRTKPEFGRGCDINYIVKRFNIDRRLPLMERHPIYDDFSTAIDYHDAMNVMVKANEQFRSLPAAVRKRFANDPQEFLEFVENLDNLDEMVKLGIAKAEVEEPEEPVEPPPSG